jgi:hypothetical protein
VDDAVPASSRARIDAENRHDVTLGAASDVSFPRGSLDAVRGIGFAAAALLLAGCGASHDASETIQRAQAGLGRIKSGTVELRVTVHALIPVERTAELPADELPLSKLDLTRWTTHPRRLACARGLECARADVDVQAALRDLDPLLPSLPVDPDSIHSARVDVAVDRRNHLPRWLRLHGELDPGGMVPGGVPIDVELELKRLVGGFREISRVRIYP